jgi:hypothetical protein
MKFTISLATVLCIALAGVLFFGVPAFSADEDIEALGDANEDWVYTGVKPCRIVDTRKIGGAFTAGESREYFVYGDVSGQQGGNPPYSVKCPAPKGEPRAVHINVTAVGGPHNGNFRVYKAGITTPATSWVNWQANKNVANMGTVKTRHSNAATTDIEVYAHTSADLVIDVMGYYYDVEPLFPDEGYASGPGQNPDFHLSFLAPTVNVEISRNNQKVFVDSTNLFCAEDSGGVRDARDLTLWICYQDVLDPPTDFNTIYTVGEGIGDAGPSSADGIEIEGDQAIPMGMSAFIYGLKRGTTYRVGLCGSTTPAEVDDWSGCHAPTGSTTAFVVPE